MLLPIDPRTASTDPVRPGRAREADGCAGTALPATPDDFCGWLATAMPGDAIVYYRGRLGRDRCRSTGAVSEPERQRLIALARQALLAAEAGRVHLVQRRLGDFDLVYVAVKAPPPGAWPPSRRAPATAGDPTAPAAPDTSAPRSVGNGHEARDAS